MSLTRPPLDVWLYGTRTAVITETVDGRLTLGWTDEAADRWGPGARLLSAKLTIGDRAAPPLVKNYLDGLLPEGNARVNHAMSASVPPDDTFALIREYGRDTLGAAIFVPEGSGDPTKEGRYEPLTTHQVATRVSRADEHAPATETGMVAESSTLPGMVPKITLHRDERGWFACKDGAASTWIVKRAQSADSNAADVVDTEVACLELARTIGLTTIQAEIFSADGVRGIAVSRYDRAPGRARIHQEDLAQATGLNTQDPNRKFQWGSAMPSLRHAADVLRLDGGNPDDLLRLVTFSHLVGNTDMHAKNISFLRLVDGRVELSPAYDIAMHLHHRRDNRRDNRRSALDINGKQLMAAIAFEDIVAEAIGWGMTRRRALNVAGDTARSLHDAVEAVDRSRHPGVSDAAWEIVRARVRVAVDDAKWAVGGRPDSRADPSSPEVGSAREPTQRRRGPNRPR